MLSIVMDDLEKIISGIFYTTIASMAVVGIAGTASIIRNYLRKQEAADMAKANKNNIVTNGQAPAGYEAHPPYEPGHK